MKSILLPTDFSSNANRALEYALQLSKVTGAQLTLLHVYTPVVSKGNVMHALITDEVGDATREARQQLSVIVNTITSEFPEVACTTQVRVGEAVDEILLAAKEINCDLIIMGTLGASNISKMIFGSNTASIIEKSECPVLAIPHGCSFRPPGRILFATNFKYNDLEGVKKLTVIAQAFQAEIILGHVDVSLHDEDEVEQTMENFFNEVQTITDYPKISCRTVSDHNVSMGLEKIIEEQRIDLFALSTRKRTWFEKLSNPSLTKKISHYATIPLLAFHNPADDEMDGPDF